MGVHKNFPSCGLEIPYVLPKIICEHTPIAPNALPYTSWNTGRIPTEHDPSLALHMGDEEFCLEEYGEQGVLDQMDLPIARPSCAPAR